ncbi:MAG: DUF4383 domain-containing protein [Candidatus Dormibacteria bacterium]
MSLSKMAAGVFGAVYVLVGILGFIPALTPMGSGTDNLLGLFPISTLHNIVHILVGVAGLAAYSQGAALSRTFAQVVGVTYLLLAVLGLVIGNSLGFLPIGGLDIGLHAVTAIVLLYVGFAAPNPVEA